MQRTRHHLQLLSLLFATAGFFLFGVSCLLGESCRKDTNCPDAQRCVRGRCKSFEGELYVVVSLPAGMEERVKKVTMTMDSLALSSPQSIQLESQGVQWVKHVKELRAGAPLHLRFELFDKNNTLLLARQVREVRPNSGSVSSIKVMIQPRELTQPPP